MDGVRPSSVAAPSIWYDAVAVPQTKPGGNATSVPSAAGFSCVVVTCVLSSVGASGSGVSP